MKNLFLDLETSGLDETRHVILEAGLLLDNGTEDDPSPLELVIPICPTEEEWAKADSGALKVNQFTLEELKVIGLPMEDARLKIGGWLYANNVCTKTTQYIGQNPKFDIRFLRRYMGVDLDWLGFPWDALDTIQMAQKLSRLDHSIKFPNFKGWGIAQALGVEEEGDKHRALGGVRAVRRNFYALQKRLSKLN